MTVGPGYERVRVANAGSVRTVDTVATNAAIGPSDERATQWERISGTGSGTVASAINVPTNVRLVILGFTVHAPLGVGAVSTFVLEITRAGNALLGTSDATLGTFAPIGEPAVLPAGAVAISADGLFPAGLQGLTSPGDGSNPVFRIVAAGVPGGDDWRASVFFDLIDSKDFNPC